MKKYTAHWRQYRGHMVPQPGKPWDGSHLRSGPTSTELAHTVTADEAGAELTIAMGFESHDSPDDVHNTITGAWQVSGLRIKQA